MKREIKVEIMPWCKGCPVCYNVCPAPKNVFELVDGKPKVVRPEYCFGCGLCEELCPAKAVKVTGYREPHRLPFNTTITSLAQKVI